MSLMTKYNEDTFSTIQLAMRTNHQRLWHRGLLAKKAIEARDMVRTG